MSGHLLPHALLELTLARASARLEGFTHSTLRRHGANAFTLGRRYTHHQDFLRDAPVPEHVPYEVAEDRSLYARRDAKRSSRSALSMGGLFPHSQDGPITELERRITELKEAPVLEELEPSEPAFSDSELVSIYEELLAVPPRTQTQDVVATDHEAQQQADESTLEGIVHSLYQLEDPTSIAQDTRSQYLAAIAKLTEIVGVLESAKSPEVSSDVSVLSTQEWVSLVRICVRESDGKAAEAVIDLMKRSGSSGLEDAINIAMDFYADSGDVANTERFLETYVGQVPSDRQRHLHVKAHLRSAAGAFPTSALQVLHDYETRGAPAPMKTYTRAINTLFGVRSAVAEAQAWDLFAHMRYVAHPTPDAFLYAAMINACAPRLLEPQPARALDLWTEMTVDKGIPPTALAYNAVISACARSGEKAYVSEAFRLAKQMLDGHRDAYGNSAFRPNQQTFSALLEGAKRTGDLAKVRWILAEIISESLQAARGDLAEPVLVDENIMTHVFHGYATYRPAFNRAATVVVDSPPATTATTSSANAASPSDRPDAGESSSTQTEDTPGVESEPRVPEAPRKPQFTRLLPQSKEEVLGETRSLFARILNDTSSGIASSAPGDQDSAMPPAFENVRLTPRLVNAYLSVHYAHATLDEAMQLYRTLFSRLGVEKNAWSYVEALERCTRAPRRGPERKLALQFAREVWAEWQPVEDAWRQGLPHPAGVNARMVERANTAMIRVLSLTGRPQEAVKIVRAFVEHYPADAVKQTGPKSLLRSTRTSLAGARPLVRLLTPTEVPDDTVPPLLSFQEVEILHQRLVTVGDVDSVRYLTWVCESYAGALKRRKESALRAQPEPAAQARIAQGEEAEAA